MESMKANFSHWAMIIRIRAGMVTGGEAGRFPSLGLISPDAAMGYWIQYWGGKRENSIENIEKV